MRGLGNRIKRAIVKEVIHSFNSEIILIQESKLSALQDSTVKEIWGNGSTGWCGSDVVGSARGMLVIWNSRSFIAKDQRIGVFSMSVLLEERANNTVWMLTTI